MTQEDDIKITFLISEMKKKAEADSCPTDSEKLAAWCRKVAGPAVSLSVPDVDSNAPEPEELPINPVTLLTGLLQPATPPPRPTLTRDQSLLPINPVTLLTDLVQAPTPTHLTSGRSLATNSDFPVLLPPSIANSRTGVVNPNSLLADLARASADPQEPGLLSVDKRHLRNLRDNNQIAVAGLRTRELRQGLNSPEGIALKSNPALVHFDSTGNLVPVPPPTDTENFLKFLQDNQANIAAGVTGAGLGRISQPANPEAGMFGGIAGGVGGRLAFQKLMELAGNSLASGSPAAQTILNYGVRPAMALAGSLLGSRGATKLFGSTPPKPKVDPVKQRQLELYRNLAQASGRRGA